MDLQEGSLCHVLLRQQAASLRRCISRVEVAPMKSRHPRSSVCCRTTCYSLLALQATVHGWMGPIVLTSQRTISTTLFSLQNTDTFVSSLAESSSWEEGKAEGSFENTMEEESDEEGFDSLETTENSIVSTAIDSNEIQLWCQSVDRTVKNLEKKQQSLQRELSKVEQVEAKTARANLIQSNLYLFPRGVMSATVQDWETGETLDLEIDPSFKSAVAEVEALFSQLRKIKRGATIVKGLLEESTDAFERMTQLQTRLRSSRANDDLEGFRLVQAKLLRTPNFVAPKPSTSSTPDRTSPSTRRKPALGSPASNIRKLTSPSGATVFVGRNRRGNEHVSLRLAKANDMWMHARGTPGAHVVVRSGGSEITAACRQFAANIAAFYSDGRNERKVLVTMTSAKHITKPRGAPLGAVQVRQEEDVLTGMPEDVPELLQEARAASGLDNEYRAADKAKLRKQNRQREAAKQKRRRKKAKQR